MNQEELVFTLKLAKDIFLRAMLEMYSGRKDNKVIKSKSISENETTLTYPEGKFVVVNRYWTSKGSNTSSGIIIILLESNPIWTMTHIGEYPKEVIPSLKHALMEEYKNGSFRGGRGPTFWEDDKYRYQNSCSHGSTFDHFWGSEKITVAHTHGSIGFLGYQGTSMIGHPTVRI